MEQEEPRAEEKDEAQVSTAGNGASRLAWGTYGLVLAIVVFMAIATFGGKFAIVDQLRDPAFARGLITILITLSVIALVLTAGLFALLGGRDLTHVKKRIELASTATAGLLGILGTIVGFYFAASTGDTVKLALSPIEVTRSAEVVSVTAFVHGGDPPYTWEISDDWKGLSDDGWIQTESAVGDLDMLVLDVVDARNNSVQGKTSIPAGPLEAEPEPTSDEATSPDS